jgi:hypothetical protein
MYRIKEENNTFEIQIKISKKSLFRQKREEWSDVDQNGKPFKYMRVGTLYRVDNWESRLKPFTTKEDAENKIKIFEKGIIYHNEKKLNEKQNNSINCS